MTIINGQVADADEVMNAMGSLFNDTAQNLFNAAYIGFDSDLNLNTGAPELKNLKYDCFLTDTMTETNTKYNSTNKTYEFKKVDDEIDNSSYTANWTAATSVPSGTSGNTATVVEDTEKLRATTAWTGGPATTGSASATSDGTSPINYYNSGKDVHIILRYAYDVSIGANASAFNGLSATLKLEGTTGSVTLVTSSITGTSQSESDDAVYDIYINATASTCDLYKDGVLDTADIDISGLTGTDINIKIATAGNNNLNEDTSVSAVADLYYLYSRSVDVEYSIVSPTTSVSSTNAIAIMNADDSISIKLSSDNGSNYEDATNALIHRFTNTGSNLIFKATETISSISVPEDIPEISEYAVKYNLY